MSELAARTERLRLRTWDRADLALFARHTNTPAVMRHLGGVMDEEKLEALYTRVTTCQAKNGFCFWVVERVEDDALLGFCGLKRVDARGARMTGDFEIGWRLREDAWGMGYAREAATAGLTLAFTRFDAPHVIALTVDANRESWGLMTRLGMRRRPDLDFVDPRYGPELNPTIVYSLSREEWAKEGQSAQ